MNEHDYLLSEECRTVRVAKSILRQRRRRNEYFRPSLFAEPGWDMLLDLYVRDNSGASATTAQLLMATTTPTSTTARWLELLQDDGLVILRNHPDQSGTQFVELSDKARQGMKAYLTTVREP